jgi:hypothetical protein
MRSRIPFTALALLEAFALGASFAEPAAAGGRALAMFGLTADQRLIRFREHRPSAAKDVGAVTGLSGDARLVGIDFRPATGALYGLGDAGGIYTLDLASAEATFVSQLSSGGVPLTLAGASFGVDFNPTVDRLRVVSDAGQNLRVNVDTGAATVDPDLNSPGPPPVTATGIVGAGYTNNDADPNTATTLYDLDSLLDQVSIQAPPNAGSLNPVGKLGVDAGPQVGFDVHSRLRDGSTRSVEAFAALSSDRSRLYAIDLFTGRAVLRGSFAVANEVIGLAIPPNQR